MCFESYYWLRYCRNEVVKRVRDRKRILTFIIHERVLLISDGEQKENENLIFNNGNREGGERVEIVLVSFQLRWYIFCCNKIEGRFCYENLSNSYYTKLYLPYLENNSNELHQNRFVGRFNDIRMNNAKGKMRYKICGIEFFRI